MKPEDAPAAGESVTGHRVLFLTNIYPTAERPWHGAFVANQADALRQLGHEVEILHLDGSLSRREYLRAVPRLRAALREVRFDLVHAHYGLTGLVGRCQARRPLIVTMLGSDLLWARQRILSRIAAAAADLTLVMSREMKRLVRSDRCCILPNGTDLRIFRPLPPERARAEVGWEPGDFVVLFPADPAREVKDFALAEAAAAAAKRLGVERLRLAPAHGTTQARHNVRLNAADACLLTSRWEGSSNAIREALAVGLPVVSVPAGDAREVLNGVPHCAVRDRRAEDLADSLFAVWRRQRERGVPLRHGGRTRVGVYSSDRIARILSRLYDRVLAGDRDGARLQAELCPEFDRCAEPASTAGSSP